MNRSLKKAFCSFLSFVITISSVLGIGFTASATEELYYLVGDIDLNCRISLKDASYAQRFDVGLEALTDEQIIIGNCDGIDGITLRDAYVIQRYTLELLDDYPVNDLGYRIGDIMPYSYNTDTENDSDTEIITDTETDNSDITDTLTDNTDTEDTETDNSDFTDTLSDNTDTDNTETDNSDITDTLTDNTDTDNTDTETENTDIITDTDTEDTDSEEPVVVRPLDEILYDLNGNFDRPGEDGLPENYIKGWVYSNITREETGGINNSPCLKLTSSVKTATRVSNWLSGFEPNGEYKLTAMVKGVNVEGDDHADGTILDVGSIMGGGWNIGQFEDGSLNFGRGYMIDSYNNYMKGTFDWTPVTCYFIADGRGFGDITCAFYGTGTVYFDDLNIEKVDYDSEPTDKVRIVGEHMGIVVYKEDIEGLDHDTLVEYVGELDHAYELMADLMDAAPFGGDKNYIISTTEPYVMGVQAYGAINPIKWQRGYMKGAMENRCTQNMKTRVAYHEMGHNFDTMYPWSYWSEASADYKASYVILNHTEGVIDPRGSWDLYPIDEYLNFLDEISKTGYEKTIRQRDGQYTLDALNYMMVRTSQAVGWDTVKETFKQFAAGYDRDLYTTRNGKFFYWFKCMQETYDNNHPGSKGYTIYDSFPEGDLEYIRSLNISSVGTDGYKPEEDIFMVDFRSPDGEKLGFRYVRRGDSADAPDVLDSEAYGKFLGWNKDFSNVTSDMTITAKFENYTDYATINVDAQTAYYQGEVIGVSVSDVDDSSSVKFVCTSNKSTVYESSYSSARSAKILLTDDGDYTIYAMVKKSDGSEYMSDKAHLNVAKAVTVYYSGFANPYIHYRIGTGNWTTVPGVAMTAQNDIEGYTHKYTIPLGTNTNITCCFNDGGNNWDNNNKNDYKLNAGAYGIKNGNTATLTN